MIDKGRMDKPYYKTDTTTLLKGDSLELLKEIEDNSIDLIFADPPYFLSNDGISCKSGKMVSVIKVIGIKLIIMMKLKILIIFG